MRAQEGLTGPNAFYNESVLQFDFNETCGGYASGILDNQSDEPVATVPNYFFTVCEEEKFDFFTFRAALDYEITPDNLIYASFNTRCAFR